MRVKEEKHVHPTHLTLRFQRSRPAAHGASRPLTVSHTETPSLKRDHQYTEPGMISRV